MTKATDLAAQIAELDDPADIAEIVVAALDRMGSQGRQASDALIERMTGDSFADSDAYGNVKEAITWLSDEVTDEIFS